MREEDERGVAARDQRRRAERREARDQRRSKGPGKELQARDQRSKGPEA